MMSGLRGTKKIEHKLTRAEYPCDASRPLRVRVAAVAVVLESLAGTDFGVEDDAEHFLLVETSHRELYRVPLG